jgi:hypothetical protein
MYIITANIYYSQLSSVAILLQPEPVSHRIIQGNDRVLSPYVLSSFGLPQPSTCLALTVSQGEKRWKEQGGSAMANSLSMYSITENICYSQLSSVAILLQPEPVSHHIIQGNDCVFSPYALSSFGLHQPSTCLSLTVSQARSYFASTIRDSPTCGRYHMGQKQPHTSSVSVWLAGIRFRHLGKHFMEPSDNDENPAM